MKRTMLAVTSVWLLLTVAYGYATVRAKLALPPSPELYTHSAAFQTFSFIMGKLPPLVVLLVVILAFQLIFLHAEELQTRLLRRTLQVGVVVIGLLLLRFMYAADVPYNPWYQYDEQLALTFLLARLPIYAVCLAGILVGELWWLKSRAS